MALIDFTSYEAVRAALGVNIDEISDATLALDLYDLNLQVELDGISVGLTAVYLAAKANPTPTDAEKKLLRSASLFACYAVARHLAVSMPLFAAKDVSDGKATVGRWTDNAYRDVIKGIDASYLNYQKLVSTDYASLIQGSSVTSVRTFMVVSSPSYDPVTGV